jgi:hypothetical protein
MVCPLHQDAVTWQSSSSIVVPFVLSMCHPHTSTHVAWLVCRSLFVEVQQVAGRGRKRHLSLQGTVPDQATSAQMWYSTVVPDRSDGLLIARA